MSGGHVALVGAGPGDPDLITVKGLELLRQADLVLYDRLIPHSLLREAKPTACLVDVGKAVGSHAGKQREIEEQLVAAAETGLAVVRLKGGDPFVFGRGFEELEACRAAGIPCDVVPGVTSAVAAPLAAGIPVSLRGVAQNFAVVTAQGARDGREPDWDALARLDTLVVLMGCARLEAVVAALLVAGKTPSTPAALIERATLPGQRVVRAELAGLTRAAAVAGLGPPTVAVIGEVARHARCQGLAAFAASPLAGRRVVVTRPRTASRPLLASLAARGATAIDCPLIAVDTVDPAAWEGSFAGIAALAFTSRHGVLGFWQALRRRGLDARALAGLALAASAPEAARTLERCGLGCDLMPEDHRAGTLARALLEHLRDSQGRVLFPCGTRARGELSATLRAGGRTVEELTVYITRQEAPDAATRRDLAAGVDAVLLTCPTAVDSFRSAHLEAPGATYACIGEETARRARSAGLAPLCLASKHTDDGLLQALETHFSINAAQAA